MTSVPRSAEAPERTAFRPPRSASTGFMPVDNSQSREPSDQPPFNSTDVASQRREPSRSDLLLASLQRVYRTEDAALTLPAGTNATAGTAVSDPTHRAAIGLIETVFEVGDLDPFPFVNRRDDSTEGELKSSSMISASLPAGEPLPAEDDQSSVPMHAASDASQVPASEADRRKLPRRESDCSVVISAYSGDGRLSPERTEWIIRAAKTRGHLVDVSMSGVAVQLTDEIAPGTRVVLRIANRTLSKHVDASGTVLRCRRDGETGWNVVCRFDKNLTFEQIHLIGRNLFAYTIV